MPPQVNDKIFFIHRGTVQVFKGYGAADPASTVMLNTLEDNDFFGEASLLQGEAPPTRPLSICFSGGSFQSASPSANVRPT